ncbi:ABC transporter ATP-binding protein [Maritimibacter alkaliphilus]|uniref:ABC transporter ATP-binding protein n=1 Tax=Maritimibacter alkaliphilus TaxID=404236 RepID=UPI001C98B7F2|nr:ABC transporter ATP-binding protein [Maritimibacter alkaliphilus]MBY6091731.1 ABC transporter ATP-binding protein [Maritimibacter alkaliphilus]
MLKIEGVDVSYGAAQVLRGVSLTAEAGQITCLMGRNGAGKTTLMKAIMGLLPLGSGQIALEGAVLSDLPPHEVPKQGVGYIPQGRRLFGELTVAQNIDIGLMARGSDAKLREELLEIFPRLRERLGQRADTLSGGEQQMLATARALALRPKLLLLDEPTEGLQPSMIEAIRQVVLTMRDRGVAVVLVEQRVEAVLDMADRVFVIEMGANRDEMDRATLRADPARLRAHLGV